MEEEAANLKRQSEELEREIRNLDRTMLLILVTMAVCRLGLHAWANWCVIMLLVLVTPALAQDTDSLSVTEGLNIQAQKGDGRSWHT